MELFRILVAVLTLGCTLPASATQILESPVSRVSLLELYTSEGCSSCPPADAWLSELKNDKRLWNQVIPVAFHVDYWDYIGWPDRFASPAHSKRQHDYARAHASRTVYTPAFIVDGKEWRKWFSRPELQLKPGPEVGSLKVEISEDTLDASFPHSKELPDTLELHLAVLGFDLENKVAAGENRGRTLTHDFTVIGYEKFPISRMDETYKGTYSLPAPRHRSSVKALAAWLSLPDNPQPVQVVGGWLMPTTPISHLAPYQKRDTQVRSDNDNRFPLAGSVGP